MGYAFAYLAIVFCAIVVCLALSVAIPFVSFVSSMF